MPEGFEGILEEMGDELTRLRNGQASSDPRSDDEILRSFANMVSFAGITGGRGFLGIGWSVNTRAAAAAAVAANEASLTAEEANWLLYILNASEKQTAAGAPYLTTLADVLIRIDKSVFDASNAAYAAAVAAGATLTVAYTAARTAATVASAGVSANAAAIAAAAAARNGTGGITGGAGRTYDGHLDDAYSELMLNYGAASAGHIFFVSGL